MILGLNLAVEPYSIGLVHGDDVLMSYSTKASYHFSEFLMDDIERLLNNVSVSLDQLKGVGVVVGPGSYTGLRIGVSTAKTIGQIYKIPVFDLITFEALLYPYLHQEGVYLVVIPARKKEYNLCLLSCKEGEMRSLTPSFCLTESRLKEVLPLFNGPLKIVGLERSFYGYSHYIPSCIRGEILSFMAQKRLVCGDEGDYRTLRPCYSHQPQLRSF